MAAFFYVWPAWEVEQFMLVGDRGLVLQLPQHYTDEVGILDDDGHLLEHMLEADVGLLQAGEWGTERRRRMSEFMTIYDTITITLGM